MKSLEMTKRDISNAVGMDLTNTTAEEWEIIELAIDSSAQDDMEYFSNEEELLQAYVCGAAHEHGFEDKLTMLKKKFELLEDY